MRSFSFFPLFLFLALSLYSANAYALCDASSEVNKPCLQEGETCMSAGRDAILACLRSESVLVNKNAGLVWKSYTGGGSAPSGYKYTYSVLRGDGPGWSYYGANVMNRCIQNAPAGWQFVSYDVCFEDGWYCSHDGLLCIYAKPK